MQEIPVYLFTGFMDSGKTSLIQETIFENNFTEGAKCIIITCEDGDVEYDSAKLNAAGVEIISIEDKNDFSEAKLNEINSKYHPEMVFLEYNGTWEVAPLLEMELPKAWVIVQKLATVDAGTFEIYMQNMRTMMMEQLFAAEVVIFNRCPKDVNKAKFRANIKNFNRPAQIVYELEDGTVDTSDPELPFDMNADVIEISDADYALWYMDCSDNPKKYDGKTVHFKAVVYNPPKLKKGVMVPGRFAMTCCVEDIQFLGFIAKYDKEVDIPHKSWIDFTAKIHVEFNIEYKGKGPVYYPISVTPCEKPEDELVYFN